MVLAQRPTDIIREHVFRGLASAEDDGRIRDWQQMPELPLAEELMGPHPLPLPTFEGGAFSVKEDYLEAQYLMTRSEGTELLRKAINEFRKSPNMMEGSGFYIYTQVCLPIYVCLHMSNSFRCMCRGICSLAQDLPVESHSQLKDLQSKSTGANLDAST